MTPLRFALLGDPVAHSKSPVMHEAAFRALGLPHRYDAIRCAQADLGVHVDALRRGALAGLNVTVPHKRAVLELVDAVDPTARRVGAANTLVREGGRVIAHNTDVAAIAHELERVAPGVRGGAAIVLGSGGAARAAIVACCMYLDTRRVDVRARDLQRTRQEDLAPLAQGADLTVSSLAPNAELEREASFVIQATSAGMAGVAKANPGEAVAAAIAWSSLPARAGALEVVYAPPETPFVRAANEHGIRVTSGLGMLAWQGALALELWLGVPAPFDAMLAALQRAAP